jgi:hypothetical protein
MSIFDSVPASASVLTSATAGRPHWLQPFIGRHMTRRLLCEVEAAAGAVLAERCREGLYPVQYGTDIQVRIKTHLDMVGFDLIAMSKAGKDWLDGLVQSGGKVTL